VTGERVDPLGPHLDDERLSALLDGMAEPSDAAHADRCPECATRLVGWRQTRQLVAVRPAVVPEDRREAAIRAALAAFDATEEEDGTGPIDLAAARRRRLQSIGAGRAAAAAAAAVVLVAGLAFGLSRINHNHPISSAGRAIAGPSGSSKRATPSSLINGPASPTSLRPAHKSLGGFTDMSSLIQTLRSTTQAESAPSASYSTVEPTAPVRCPAPFTTAGVTADTPPELERALVYAGTQAVVFVYSRPRSHVVVVENASTCAVLAQGAF
jgi:hypothetical protein